MGLLFQSIDLVNYLGRPVDSTGQLIQSTNNNCIISLFLNFPLAEFEPNMIVWVGNLKR